ncbi:hypothetical protein GH714_023179 [Hevea brasiliensis]|uniref:G-patch domain-containing protein n=1 Tax=Hevea brasiliensis TaxID=3981 RepID=A0A6A6LIR5_HEVBR|nr:hypothetical protein GH714_023179 [Hevea brasiliensis]
MLEAGWRKGQGLGIQSQIRAYSVELEIWGEALRKNFKIKLDDCKNRMKLHRRGKDVVSVKLFEDANIEYQKLLNSQEAFWKQRAKQHWLSGVLDGDSKGAYTVKSGYRKVHVDHFNVDQSSVLVWRRLRKSAIPPKVKNFIWRAILNILPTCCSLSGRRVDVFDVCPMCGGESETAVHVLFNLFMLRIVRTLLLLVYGILMFIPPLTGCPIYILLLWQDAQHLQLIDHASSLLRHQVKWSPPSVGRLKCNFDAATSCLHNRVGTGWIIRGSAGQFLAAGFKTFEGGSNALQAEVLSFKEALNRVKNNNWGAVDFESDSMLLFQSFFNSSTDLSYVGVLIDDYHCFFKELGDSSLSFIRKSANQAAQCCTSVCSMSGSLEWSSTAPSFLEDVLNFDLNYCLNKSILFWLKKFRIDIKNS